MEPNPTAPQQEITQTTTGVPQEDKLSRIESIKKFIREDKFLAGLIGVLAFFIIFGAITLAFSSKGSNAPTTNATVTIPTFSSPSPNVDAQFQNNSDLTPSASPSATPTATPSATPTPSSSESPSPSPSSSPTASASASPAS